jgi:hypothetical protein
MWHITSISWIAAINLPLLIAQGEGLEPPSLDPKSRVLPLDDPRETLSVPALSFVFRGFCYK